MNVSFLCCKLYQVRIQGLCTGGGGRDFADNVQRSCVGEENLGHAARVPRSAPLLFSCLVPTIWYVCYVIYGISSKQEITEMNCQPRAHTQASPAEWKVGHWRSNWLSLLTSQHIDYLLKKEKLLSLHNIYACKCIASLRNGHIWNVNKDALCNNFNLDTSTSTHRRKRSTQKNPL